MSGFDDLIERLTARLRVDPELRMDVANELLSHLEDASEEFRQGGAGEDEAAASAVKALGDEAELSEQLWQANRGRIRFRRAAKWAARAALLPGAILITLAIAASIWLPWRFPFRQLTDEQRFIFRGDAAAEGRLAKARSIADRWPDDPVYYANYIVAYLTDETVRDKLDEGDPAIIAQAIDELSRGERIDPDNAFYNFMKATVLIRSSSKLGEDPDHTYEQTDRHGKTETKKCCRVEITDPAGFRRGLEELRRGLGKSKCDHHALDMLKHRLSLLPEPTRLADYLRRLMFGYGTFLPRLGEMRSMAKSVLAHALELARQGRREQAAELLKAVEMLAAKMGADAETLIGLLIAQTIRSDALGHAINVYGEPGLPARAARARADLDAEDRLWRSLWAGRRLSQDDLLRAGLSHREYLPALPGYFPVLGPMRAAEYAVAEQLALVVLLGAVIVLAAAAGLITVIGVLRCRGRDDGPKLLFVGWRRLGRICLLAVILPLGAYAVYAHALPVGGRGFGLPFMAERLMLEFLIVFGVVVGLLLGMSYSAVRARAAEAGIDVPPPLKLRKRLAFIIAGALLSSAAAVYLAGWQLGHFRRAGLDLKDFRLGVAVSIAIAAYLLAWGIYELTGLRHLRGRLAHFRRTLFRSIIPVLAAATIVVGAICGWSLSRVEADALARMRGPTSALNWTHQIELSNFRLLRDRHAQQHEAMLAELRRARRRPETTSSVSP